MRKIKSRKAVSPVIATVILVAVAITVAVAVSYWMSGISSQYTKFEKVEIQSGVCTWDDTNYQWNIQLKVKNTGTATSTLIGCFISEIEVDNYTVTTPADGEASTDMTTSKTINSGESVTINIHVDGPGDAGESTPPVPDIDYWHSVSAGTTINIKIHSAGGMDYIKLIELV